MTAVLLVEDDERISEPLIRVLRSEGFEVEHVATGRDAIAAVERARPDLVLLDLTLPDLDGLDVCRKSALDHPEPADHHADRPVRGDGRHRRPQRRRRRLRRQAVPARRTRRTDPRPTAHRRAARDSATPSALLERRRHRTRHRGAPMLRRRRDDGTRTEVELTTKEFDLLELLMRQPGVTLKREQIMSEVWDSNWWGSTRTLDTHTSTLRRKILDDTDPPSKIVTVRGVGFRFEPYRRLTRHAPPPGALDHRRGDGRDPGAARARAADRAERRRVGTAVASRSAAHRRSPTAYVDERACRALERAGRHRQRRRRTCGSCRPDGEVRVERGVGRHRRRRSRRRRPARAGRRSELVTSGEELNERFQEQVSARRSSPSWRSSRRRCSPASRPASSHDRSSDWPGARRGSATATSARPARRRRGSVRSTTSRVRCASAPTESIECSNQNVASPPTPPTNCAPG